MKYKPKSVAALQIALGGLPDKHDRIAIFPSGELRRPEKKLKTIRGSGAVATLSTAGVEV
jgi:hypothetical protein